MLLKARPLLEAVGGTVHAHRCGPSLRARRTAEDDGERRRGAERANPVVHMTPDP